MTKKPLSASSKVKTNPRQRRVQERAEITIEKLREAASQLFSERGYDGASIRDIENAAGVKRGLINYHFGTKEALWKAVLQHIFGLVSQYMDQRAELIKDLSPQESISYLIRSYVRFNAAYPELNRLMVHEAKRDTPRLEYIVETYTRPAMEHLRRHTMASLSIEPDEFFYWYYMFIGSSALMYTMGPEGKLLFGVDVADEDVIDRHAAFIADFLLNRSGAAAR